MAQFLLCYFIYFLLKYFTNKIYIYLYFFYPAAFFLEAHFFVAYDKQRKNNVAASCFFIIL